MSKVRVEQNKIYCPVNGWDCPYWRKDGACAMREVHGVGPKYECDDYDFFWGEDGVFPDGDEEE